MKTQIKNFLLKNLPNSTLKCLKSLHYCNILKNSDFIEEIDLKIIPSLLKEGQHALDIGANIGVYTKRLSEIVGNNGKVLSIEPIPESHSYLCNNISKLKLENVEIAQVAVSDKNGKAKMLVPKSNQNIDNFYMARLAKTDETVEDKQQWFEVETQTIDQLCNSKNLSPSFIKIDVEGAELTAIKGCLKTIEKNKPSFLIEISEDFSTENSTANVLKKILEDFGYSAHWYDGELLQRYSSGDHSVNYFFLQKHHLDALA